MSLLTSKCSQKKIYLPVTFDSLSSTVIKTILLFCLPTYLQLSQLIYTWCYGSWIFPKNHLIKQALQYGIFDFYRLFRSFSFNKGMSKRKEHYPHRVCSPFASRNLSHLPEKRDLVCGPHTNT